jgi:hypothetical protein
MMMTSEITTSIEARTRVGVLIKTFDCRAVALAWWDDNSVVFPGATLHEVQTETRVTRRCLRKTTLKLVGSA